MQTMLLNNAHARQSCPKNIDDRILSFEHEELSEGRLLTFGRSICKLCQIILIDIITIWLGIVSDVMKINKTVHMYAYSMHVCGSFVIIIIKCAH